MIGSKERMPKRLRYPLFLLGLAVMLLGGIGAYESHANPSELASIIVSGFAFLVLAVVFR
jgi:hypothetical protein